jgi:Phosphate transport (Pho88)
MARRSFSVLIVALVCSCCGARALLPKGSSGRVVRGRKHDLKTAPVWCRARGGAIVAADESNSESSDSDAGEETGDGGMSDTEYVSEQSAEDAEDNLFSSSSSSSSSKAKSSKPTAAAAAAASSDAAVAQPFPVQGLFHLAKQMAVSFLAMNLVKRLEPSNSEHVRIARIIYTVYLVVYHAVLMWLRLKIVRENDLTEIIVPPAPQLSKMLSRASAPGDSSSSSAAAASPLGGAGLQDMLSKLMVRKTTVKSFDLKLVDSMRTSLVATSLFMCLLHLKMGMIKPIILGSALGVWQLTENPLFKVHVLRMKAEGKLARPFVADQSLQEWMKTASESAQAKATEAAKTAAAETATADDSSSTSSDTAADDGSSSKAAFVGVQDLGKSSQTNSSSAGKQLDDADAASESSSASGETSE